MSTVNKNVRHGTEWGRCMTCGRSWPVTRLRNHRRFSWQCIDCWDGGPQRDEIEPKLRLYEGTRRSAAPTVDPDEGTT